MAWKTSFGAPLGSPPFQPSTVDTTARYPVGTIVRGYDDALGEGEFIYLPGVASLALGDCVVFDLGPTTPAVVRTLSGTHVGFGRPVGFAMGAILATQYGWYQISGIAVVSVLAAFAAGAKCFLTATAGNVDDAQVNGCQILGAISSSAIDTPVTGKAYITINRPIVQGQVV